VGFTYAPGALVCTSKDVDDDASGAGLGVGAEGKSAVAKTLDDSAAAFASAGSLDWAHSTPANKRLAMSRERQLTVRGMVHPSTITLNPTTGSSLRCKIHDSLYARKKFRPRSQFFKLPFTFDD
jgi:hypothetical protein